MSTKKIKLLAAVFVLLLVAIFASYYFIFSKIIFSPVPDVAKMTTVSEPEKFIKWTDQSEFEFEYPDYLILNPHDEDEENYAHVELTSPQITGNLILWTKDNTAADIEAFAKQEKIENFLDTSLSATEAIKEATKSGSDEKILISAIRQGYLYQIELNYPWEDEVAVNFWNKVLDKTLSSYKFYYTEEKRNDSATYQDSAPVYSTNDMEFNEEEVIE